MQFIIVAAICIGITCICIGFNYRQTKNTMDTLEKMLTVAMNGNFSEETFDETRLSALETKFAHYFQASAVSAQNVAAEKNKIKELIADISHQTKTPIANLILYSDLLREEDLPETAAENVKAVHTQAEKLKFLIESLVKLSRLENGILQFSPQKQKVQPMLEAAVNEFLPAAEEKGIVFGLHNSDVEACFDAKWTLEAVCNLIDNAVKYTKSGSITISAVSYEMFTRIDIADTGIGIKEEEITKIFSRFYRSQTVSDEAGVGIGLYLAREIFTGQGGYMKVSSMYGQGSTFSVFLPK